MTTHTTYEAEDGTIFDTAYDCIQYEAKIATQKDFNKMWDGSGALANVAMCEYVYLQNSTDVESFIALNEAEGSSSTGILQPGWYYYDDTDDAWHMLEPYRVETFYHLITENGMLYKIRRK